MKDEVHSIHCITNRLNVSYVTNVELNLICMVRESHLKVMSKVILFLLITRENSNLTNV
ncbi:hypothetical protein SDC9_165550 [bioreactor metagenome]|uniref:Uncharacterized protein n=1 Tax=bioreactor metagenome TaxID=1076179 RepID=A0A645FWV7_9ZZZZ